MLPESKNEDSKKLKSESREARQATAQKVTTQKVKAQKVKAQKTTEHTAKKLRASRSASLSSSASSTSASSTSASSTRTASSKQRSVAIIGAGQLGSALALALSQSGYAIVALVARRREHARRVARTLSTQTLALGATQLDTLPDADLLLITTPDDQIAEVAARLAQVFATRAASGKSTSRRRHRPRIALHASGALVSDALAPLGAHAFSLGSLHPLVSITEPQSGAENLRGAFYCLEGEARARAAAKEIVRALGGQSFSIAARDKPLYHAAAVMSAGHIVALFSLATEMLVRCGLSTRRASRVLLPLAASTLENLARAKLSADALTGPFARADVATLRRHVAALRELDTTETLPVYVALGRHALRLAHVRGGSNAVSRAALAEIEALLEDSD